MRELAVDFGTSNTVAALRVNGGPARLLLFDGWPVLPSAVLRGRDGTLVVGQAALRGARLDPARFEPYPKERVDDNEVLLGDAPVPVRSLIAAVLRRVAAEAQSVDRVVLTHPANWYHSRRSVLLAAAREVGWPNVHLVAEPVAAASQGMEVPLGQVVAVFDMGGGTTDVAVLRRTGAGWDVLAEAGLPDLGGRDLDQLLLEHLRVEHLMRATDADGRRAARALAEDVRAGKEALSQYAQTDIPLPPPIPDAHVTRAELERMVEPALSRAVDMLASTVSGTPVSAVYLVGGATRMPLIARMISQRLGLVPTIVDAPETTVALGALGPAPIAPQWTNVTPPTPVSVPKPQRKVPKAAIITAAVTVLVVAGGVTAAVLLRPTNTPGTADPTRNLLPATSSTTSSSSPPPKPVPAAFNSDEQLIKFAGPAARASDACVNTKGTGSQGDMYEARNHVRCRFTKNGIAYYANYMSSDNAATCHQLNQELLEAPGAQFVSQQPWSGAGFTGKSHDVTAPGGNTVLWYTDTNSLCGFFGSDSEHPQPMADVRAAWEELVKPHD
ncbi:Hsp70 family protein [Actinocrispum wychmicini]|uniref:Hsp70 family protein n=1 Tax=Actinocrispum wychmicini TaxID=1213861 RepID=UPI0014046749|nr:Hsp70 family protein [Actinocrispum wychmicini]